MTYTKLFQLLINFNLLDDEFCKRFQRLINNDALKYNSEKKLR
jgi:hypothetical protein